VGLFVTSVKALLLQTKQSRKHQIMSRRPNEIIPVLIFVRSGDWNCPCGHWSTTHAVSPIVRTVVQSIILIHQRRQTVKCLLNIAHTEARRIYRLRSVGLDRSARNLVCRKSAVVFTELRIDSGSNLIISRSVCIYLNTFSRLHTGVRKT